MKHIKRQIRRNVRAISPVLAVLMMIAVAIAGSLVVYAWIMGYIDLSTVRSGQAIQIQSVANDNTDTDLLVFVQNVGEGVAQLDEDDCLYVNGQLVPCVITGVTVSDKMATLNQGETATLRYAEGAAIPGTKMRVKVVTLLGATAEKSSYPAGSARASPVFDHFEFNVIPSPQISDVPFRITILAVDQYDEAFTSYIGTNNLVFSDGDIDPESTGGFVNGLWSGNVSVIGTAEGATISTSAASDPTWVGISEPFDVNPMVTFVASGSAGRIVPANSVDDPTTYPTGLQEDDLILLQIGIRDTDSVPDTPADFTLLFGPNSTGYGQQWIFYKWSDGTETGAITISITGSPTNVLSRAYAFRYVAAMGFTEAESFVTEQESDTITAADVTTDGARRLAVTFVYATDNQLIDEFTGETGGDWEVAGFVMGDATSSQEDAYAVAQTATMLEEGTISGGSFTRSDVYTGTGGNSWCLIAFALIPTS